MKAETSPLASEMYSELKRAGEIKNAVIAVLSLFVVFLICRRRKTGPFAGCEAETYEYKNRVY